MIHQHPCQISCKDIDPNNRVYRNESQPAFDEEQDGKANKKNKSKEDGEDDGGHVGSPVLGTRLMIVNLDVVVDVDTI